MAAQAIYRRCYPDYIDAYGQHYKCVDETGGAEDTPKPTKPPKPIRPPKPVKPKIIDKEEKPLIKDLFYGLARAARWNPNPMGIDSSTSFEMLTTTASRQEYNRAIDFAGEILDLALKMRKIKPSSSGGGGGRTEELFKYIYNLSLRKIKIDKTPEYQFVRGGGGPKAGDIYVHILELWVKLKPVMESVKFAAQAKGRFESLWNDLTEAYGAGLENLQGYIDQAQSAAVQAKAALRNGFDAAKGYVAEVKEGMKQGAMQFAIDNPGIAFDIAVKSLSKTGAFAALFGTTDVPPDATTKKPTAGGRGGFRGMPTGSSALAAAIGLTVLSYLTSKR